MARERALWGARWNSAGRPVIYAADCFAGAILEVIAHATNPRTLPGSYHAVRIDIPEPLVERLEPDALPGWDDKDSPAALAFGDAWLADLRSAALVVPAVTSRPAGRNVLIHPAHPDVGRITVSAAFPVLWDERLF